MKTTEELFKGNEGWEELPKTYEWKNALEFAKEKHEWKLRDIKGIMDILIKEERETDDVILTIAALYSVMEDTDCTKEEIEEKFGDEVAGGVDLLTQRKGQTFEDYAKKIFTNDDYPYVRKIELANRLHDLRILRQMNNSEKVADKINETEQYILPYEKCSPRNLMKKIKEELEKLKKDSNSKEILKKEPEGIGL